MSRIIADGLSSPHEEIMIAPGGGFVSGQIVQAPSGKAGYVGGLRSVDAGQPANVKTAGRVQVPCASSTEIDAGAVTEWDVTAGLAVAADGDFTLGIAAVEKEEGQTSVWVLLNDPGAVPSGEYE
jgi:predicted RecA/RadA family phage recombinase